jgi:amino acid efflux transporter
VVLTLGAVNAYVTGATEMAAELTRPRDARAAAGPVSSPAGRAARPAPRFLAAIAVSGVALISLYGLGLVSPAALVAIPTTLFLVVYLGCMASAARVLRGPARPAAALAAVIVAVVLGFCGWALLAALAVALAACLGRLVVARPDTRLLARLSARLAAPIHKRYESR